jgi:steroid 5-alpha reductase family enzyme
VSSPQFIVGISLFFVGFYINNKSDTYLIGLRKGKQKGYVIPREGLFNYVSCPNFFGELLEWLGFAIMTWSVAGLAFFLWTFFNLVPRALSHHRWYKSTFPDYPKDRKAVFPFIL